MTTRTSTRRRDERVFWSFDELRDRVAGRWEYIFEDLAPSLSEALSAAGSTRGAPRHVPCPVHGGTDGFRFFSDWRHTGAGVCNTCGKFASGFTLLAWVNGYSVKDAVKAVAAWERKESTFDAPARPPAPPPSPPDFTKAALAIKRVWSESRPISGTLAERYLERRGIWQSNMPLSLRFHPRMAYFDKEAKRITGWYPTLLAPIKDINGRIISLHRIFLDENGNKAPVADAKRMMARAGELRGCAIKLWHPGETLGLAEGLETAMAARAIARIPVWSTVSASLLESVELPKVVKHVVIWADKDRFKRPKDGLHPGEYSAMVAAKRFEEEGRTVEILLPELELLPEDKSIDWLDVMLRAGLDGFPKHWRRWKP